MIQNKFVANESAQLPTCGTFASMYTEQASTTNLSNFR